MQTTPTRNTWTGNREPSIEELLADDTILPLLALWRLEPDDVRRAVAEARRRRQGAATARAA
jgi:hypothetical protein